MNTGVFLARFQPPHKSHEYIINKMISENEKSYVFIGSADKSRCKRNPLTIQERIELLTDIYKNNINNGTLIIVPLEDYSFEDDHEHVEEWGKFLYDNIVKITGQTKVSLYYSNNPQIMIKWFNDNIANNIKFQFLDRSKLFDKLSATKIRQALIEDNIEYLKENLSETVLKRKDWLAEIIKSCN